MKKNIVFVFLLSSIFTFGQNTFIGIIEDANDQQPIPYATVSDNLNTLFTVSDEKGIFKIIIQDSLDHEYLIRSLNYEIKNISFSAKQCIDTFRVQLTPKNIHLNEVKVVPLHLDKIIRETQKIFNDNFAKNTHLAKSYYSEIVQDKDSILGTTEALANCFCLGWQKQFLSKEYSLLTEERLFFRNIRRSNYLLKEIKYKRTGKKSFSEISDTLNLSMQAQSLFRAKKRLLHYGPLNKKYSPHYLFELDETKFMAGRFFYKIKFRTKNDSKILDTKGFFLIDSDNYSLSKIEFDWFSLENKFDGFHCEEAKIQFIKMNGQVYCKYLSAKIEHEDLESTVVPQMEYCTEMKLINFDIKPIKMEMEENPHNGYMGFLNVFMSNPFLKCDSEEWKYYWEYSLVNHKNVQEFITRYHYVNSNQFINKLDEKDEKLYLQYQKQFQAFNIF